MATELQKLQVNELSGVEHPANEAPGWLVMKSADEREALLKEVDRMESDFAILYASLKAAEGYLGDAPEEVTSAASALVGYVESLFSEGEGEEPEAETETTDSAPEETVKTADTPRRSLTELIFGSVEKDADTDVEKDATVFDQDAETDDVEKDAEVETDDVEKDAEVETDDVEKDADDEEPNDTGLVEVLSRLAQGQEDLAKNLGGDIGALKDALVSTIERVERLEVRKTGLTPDADAVEKAAADPLGTAVLAALSGQRINLS